MKKLFSRPKKKLTFDETQEVITPFAFKMDDSLFGTAIASPWKRGLAIAIDFFLILLLSSAGGEFLAIAVAIMFFRSSKRKALEIEKEQVSKEGKVRGRKRRFLKRLIGAFILFIVLIETLPSIFSEAMYDNSEHNPYSAKDYGKNKDGSNSLTDNKFDGKDVDFVTAIEITAFALKVISLAEENKCDDVNCWKNVFKEVPSKATKLEIGAKKSKDLFAEIAESTELGKEQQSELSNHLWGEYLALNKDVVVDKDNNLSEVTKDAITPVSKDKSNPIDKVDEALAEVEKHQQQKESKPQKPIYSIMELIKGIIEDLGLGLGWAALYFSVFTAWWNGKTPGKRLFNIRVLQLDGTPLSMWDSFGRFGGYAAGTATGLLGFLQIFWDPNRQAIHDKISATVVIDEKKVVNPEIIAIVKEKIEAYNQR